MHFCRFIGQFQILFGRLKTMATGLDTTLAGSDDLPSYVVFNCCGLPATHRQRGGAHGMGGGTLLLHTPLSNPRTPHPTNADPSAPGGTPPRSGSATSPRRDQPTSPRQRALTDARPGQRKGRRQGRKGGKQTQAALKPQPRAPPAEKPTSRAGGWATRLNQTDATKDLNLQVGLDLILR